MSLLAIFKHLICQFRFGILLEQYCAKCGRTQHIVWVVNDEVWAKLPGPWGRRRFYGTLCLECFSELVNHDLTIDDFIVFSGGHKKVGLENPL